MGCSRGRGTKCHCMDVKIAAGWRNKISKHLLMRFGFEKEGGGTWYKANHCFVRKAEWEQHTVLRILADKGRKLGGPAHMLNGAKSTVGTGGRCGVCKGSYDMGIRLMLRCWWQ
jgi:hypothetical protein